MGRERRRRTRRSTGTRPTVAPATATGVGAAGATADAPPPTERPAAATPAAPVQVRSDRVIARESMTMISELKRVALVSSVCFGMLAVLVVVERLQ